MRKEKAGGGGRGGPFRTTYKCDSSKKKLYFSVSRVPSHVSPACLGDIYNLQMQFKLAYVSVSLERHIILICFNREKYGAGNVAAAQGIITGRDHCARGKGRKSVNVKMQVRAKYIISVYAGAVVRECRLFRAGNETRYYLRGVSEMYLCVRATLLSRPIILFEVRLNAPKRRAPTRYGTMKRSNPSNDRFHVTTLRASMSIMI